MPRGIWPSTNNTLDFGSADGNLILSKASSVLGGNEQKKLSFRILHSTQLSTSSMPYGAALAIQKTPASSDPRALAGLVDIYVKNSTAACDWKDAPWRLSLRYRLCIALQRHRQFLPLLHQALQLRPFARQQLRQPRRLLRADEHRQALLALRDLRLHPADCFLQFLLPLLHLPQLDRIQPLLASPEPRVARPEPVVARRLSTCSFDGSTEVSEGHDFSRELTRPMIISG